MTEPSYTQEYFREQVKEFHLRMGAKESYVFDEEGDCLLDRALEALAFVSVRTPLDEDERIMLDAATIEYTKRRKLMAFQS